MPDKKTSYENFSNGAQYGCTYAPFEGLAVCLRSTIFSIAIIAIMPHTEKSHHAADQPFLLKIAWIFKSATTLSARLFRQATYRAFQYP